MRNYILYVSSFIYCSKLEEKNKNNGKEEREKVEADKVKREVQVGILD